MKINLNPKVDTYLIDGCMRCKYGATPQCKVNTWRTALEVLRQFVLETGLKEEVKWSVPVYTLKGKNIVSVNALKDSANLSFFKGALLTDSHQLLSRQGNIQAGRIMKFTSLEQISKLEQEIKSYIIEAIQLERDGQQIVRSKNPEPIPDELAQAFNDNPALERAFFALTPGRQRGYILYFSQPKQTATRLARIAKYTQHILNGIGFHDDYKSTTKS